MATEDSAKMLPIQKKLPLSDGNYRKIAGFLGPLFHCGADSIATRMEDRKRGWIRLEEHLGLALAGLRGLISSILTPQSTAAVSRKNPNRLLSGCKKPPLPPIPPEETTSKIHCNPGSFPQVKVFVLQISIL